MKLLIDECLHESPVGLAHALGIEATHVNYLALSGQPDWSLPCSVPFSPPHSNIRRDEIWSTR